MILVAFLLLGVGAGERSVLRSIDSPSSSHHVVSFGPVGACLARVGFAFIAFGDRVHMAVALRMGGSEMVTPA
jgi:hypothetical protein